MKIPFTKTKQTNKHIKLLRKIKKGMNLGLLIKKAIFQRKMTNLGEGKEMQAEL